MSEKRKISLTYPVALVLAAVIVLIGNVIAAPLSDEFKRFIQKPPKLESTLQSEKIAQSESPKEELTAIDFDADTVNKAESPGFVTVYSFGDKPSHGWLKSGKSPKNLGVRTRFNKWGGATLWVRGGEHWVVTNENGGGVRVQWIPFFFK